MIKTYSELTGIPESSGLVKGMDFRSKEIRKELFFQLFEFHTGYGIHPGLVYLFLPYLAKAQNWNIEQRLWAAFLEGCTENPCTVWAIMQFFPELPKNIDSFESWHRENWRLLDYDIDVRYNKGHLVEQTQNYLDTLKGRTQEQMFLDDCYSEDKKKWFDNIFSIVLSMYKFGRMTSWSYVEFIKILSGYDYEFSTFHMEYLDGSRSERNGVLLVMGRDDLDWWRGNPGITTHSQEIIESAELYARQLTEELKERFKDKSWYKHIGYETVESTLCCYKNCFHGRRYPNIYTDMSYDRIKKAERLWEDRVDFNIFWGIRKNRLPSKLLLENNSQDPGLCPEKQGFFKKTGQLPMLSVLNEVFDSKWDRMYYSTKKKTLF